MIVSFYIGSATDSQGVLADVEHPIFEGIDPTGCSLFTEFRQSLSLCLSVFSGGVNHVGTEELAMPVGDDPQAARADRSGGGHIEVLVVHEYGLVGPRE
jgi:hypothetical protein